MLGTHVVQLHTRNLYNWQSCIRFHTLRDAPTLCSRVSKAGMLIFGQIRVPLNHFQSFSDACICQLSLFWHASTSSVLTYVINRLWSIELYYSECYVVFDCPLTTPFLGLSRIKRKPNFAMTCIFTYHMLHACSHEKWIKWSHAKIIF